MQYKLLNNEKNDFRRKIWDKRPGSGIMNKNIRGKRMQNQKKASIKLSLHQEIDREIQELEREIARHPELEEIQVTEEMDRTLLEKIRAYEKEKEERRLAEEKMGETLRRLRDDVAEDEKIGGSKRPDVEAGAGGLTKATENAEDGISMVESGTSGVPKIMWRFLRKLCRIYRGWPWRRMEEARWIWKIVRSGRCFIGERRENIG